MSKFKTFITNGEFDFWKFVFVALISAAFSAGVTYTTIGNGISANAKELEDYKLVKGQEMTDLVDREQKNMEQFNELVKIVNKIDKDMMEVKTDVKWLVKNN